MFCSQIAFLIGATVPPLLVKKFSVDDVVQVGFMISSAPGPEHRAKGISSWVLALR
jgi:hypothetical protein